MANLKEIRTRLASVKTTRQITSAMKMVAAAKLRKAQDAIIQMRPFANKLRQILSDLTQNVNSDEISLFTERKELNKVLWVVVTSNKGLCGGFNSNIAKQVLLDLKDEYADLFRQGKVDILAIGKKGAELLKAKGVNVKRTEHQLIEHITYAEVKKLALEFIQKFLSGEYDQIRLYFNSFKNAATQNVTVEQFLPFRKEKQEKYAVRHDYILEPSDAEIVSELIPKSLKTLLYKAILESNASEQGARMTAMHKATDNASELIKELQLDYNKARQTSITDEILEIVSGAEALKG